MAYSVGDKFIIEIGDVFDGNGQKLYRIKGFNSLVFDSAGLNRLHRPENYLGTIRALNDKIERLEAELKEKRPKKYRRGDVIMDDDVDSVGMITGSAELSDEPGDYYIVWADGSAGLIYEDDISEYMGHIDMWFFDDDGEEE